MTSFCPCPKNLLETESKSNELISLAAEISRQHAIDFIMCLLVSMPTQVDNEIEQMIKKEIQNIQSGKKGGNGKLGVTAKAYVRRDAVVVERL